MHFRFFLLCKKSEHVLAFVIRKHIARYIHTAIDSYIQLVSIIHGGMFCKDIGKSELANTELLLIGEIQG